jgi:hypothetical protein
MDCVHLSGMRQLERPALHPHAALRRIEIGPQVVISRQVFAKNITTYFNTVEQTLLPQ